MSATADQELNEQIIAVSRLIGSFFGSGEADCPQRGPGVEEGLPESTVIFLEDQPDQGLPFPQSQN